MLLDTSAKSKLSNPLPAKFSDTIPLLLPSAIALPVVGVAPTRLITVGGEPNVNKKGDWGVPNAVYIIVLTLLV